MQEPVLTSAAQLGRRSVVLAAAVDRAIAATDCDAAMTLVAGAIRDAGGTIVSESGQRLLAAFDTAQKAVGSALRIQGAAGQAPSIRIGVASVRSDHQASGTDTVVILAQQLRSAAPAGGIALPSALYRELSDAMSLPATQMTEPVTQAQAEPVVAVTISARDCLAWSQRGTAGRAERSVPAGPIHDDRPMTLAVVPFAAANSQVAGFAGAVTDDAIRILGGCSHWIGINRAPMTQAWRPVDLQKVRQICDTRYILHGWAEQAPGALRLTMELNEAASGRVLWSDRFDNADAGALRDICAPRIAGSTAIAVMHRELERIAAVPSAALSEADIALRALARIMQPDRASFAVARQDLDLALRRPGPHHRTYFVLVVWYLMALAQGWSADPDADRKAAVAASDHLDRDDPSSLALLGYVQAVVYRDHIVACIILDRVIDQAPYCPTAWSMKARVLIQMGEGEAAVFHADQAEALPSLGFDRAWRSTVTALACYTAERFADAARWARLAMMHHPGLIQTSRVLAASLAVLGQLDEAQQAAKRALSIDPNFRIGPWRERTALNSVMRDRYAQRLRLAGLPE